MCNGYRHADPEWDELPERMPTDEELWENQNCYDHEELRSAIDDAVQANDLDALQAFIEWWNDVGRTMFRPIQPSRNSLI